MTTISLSDWLESPEIVIGEDDHRMLTIAALTEVGTHRDHTDFLLYELDRARIVQDAMLPSDVARIGSVVRYKTIPGEERTVKLAMPHDVDPAGGYRLSVTSAHGAALLGTRPDQVMTWQDTAGTLQRLRVIAVSNLDLGDDPGPSAA